MTLTVEIDPARRTAAFREVSFLVAGDSCRVVLDGVRGADFGSLALLLYRDAASESPVASCSSFSPVGGHPALADGELALDTSEMAAWFADAVPEESDDSDDSDDSDGALPSASASAEPRLAARASLAERSVRADGWLVVLDRDRTWAACRVPVLLRPGAGASGVEDPTSVRALVEGLVSAALADKADKAPPAAAGNLASLDASGNLSDSGATPASIKAAAVAEVVANAPGTMDTLKEIADILGSSQQSGTVLKRISDLESGKANKAVPSAAGNLAALTAQGNLADSGAKASDFAAKADLPYALVEPGYSSWSIIGLPSGLVAENITGSPNDELGVTINAGDTTVYENYWGNPGSRVDFSFTYDGETVNASAIPSADLSDRAVNAVPVTGATMLTLPALEIADKSRDFYLKMTVTGSQSVSFSPSTGITYTGLGNPSKMYSAGTYLLRFTETSENEFCVASPLSASQVLAIDSVVEDRQTVAAYSGGTTLRLDISGSLSGSSVPNRESLVGLRVGSAVTGIGNLSFAGCTSLASVEMPDSVVAIADEAFSDCSGLMSVELPDSVESIGDFAFSGCENLASVSITPRPEASIGEGAFAYCTGLTYVTVGSGVLNIGPNAFAGCSSLERVTFRGKSLDEVRGMSDYPWGIADMGVIKADVALSDLPYALVSKTPANGSAALSDRAVNAVPVAAATTLTLPEKIDGKSRDFYVRLTVGAESAVTFAAADSGGDAVSWDSMGSPSGTFAAGTYLYRFTEVAAGVFHAADVTSGGSVDPAVLAGKLEATSAAPAFDHTLTYIVGEYVTYGGILYRCKIAVTVAGPWTGDSNWVDVDMTSPDATLDVRSDGRLAVVAADSEILWIQGYDMASASDVVLSCERVNFYAFASGTATQAFNMPSAPGGKVGDFVLDIDNSANASTAATATLNGFGTSFDVIVPKGKNLFTDILTFDGGEMCELYFTMTAFGTAAKPAWKVVKQVVEKQEAGS